jgi:hypothetical protein
MERIKTDNKGVLSCKELFIIYEKPKNLVEGAFYPIKPCVLKTKKINI